VNDADLLEYARKFLNNSQSTLVILDAEGLAHTNREWQVFVNEQMKFRNRLQVVQNKEIDKALLSGFDLLMISYESWNEIVKTKNAWLEHIPSTLVIKHIARENTTPGLLPVQEKKEVPEAG
jgi:hypothetical protein